MSRLAAAYQDMSFPKKAQSVSPKRTEKAERERGQGQPLEVYTLCYSAHYRLSSTCSRQIPSPAVNLPTKFCDDRAKGVGVRAIHFKTLSITKIHWSMTSMFFDQSGLFIIEISFFIKFSLDRVNLSKVLFILLFFISCKLAKNL